MTKIKKTTVIVWVLTGLLVIIALSFAVLAFTSKTTGQVGQQKSKNEDMSNDSYHSQHDMTKPTFSDIDFAQKMILLSQQMAKIGITAEMKSANPEIVAMAKKLATEEKATSSGYVEQLNTLDETYKNLSDFPQTDGHDQYPSFQGLASIRALTAYESMEGQALDDEYVRLIIEHHKGVLELAKMYNKKMRYDKMVNLLNDTERQYTANLRELEKLK